MTKRQTEKWMIKWNAYKRNTNDKHKKEWQPDRETEKRMIDRESHFPPVFFIASSNAASQA
jgi:hypothetical protein